MITVVGGAYSERCTRPYWNEVYGSGGRAASAIATMGVRVELHTCADAATEDVLKDRGAIEGFTVCACNYETGGGIEFDYAHPLAVPVIRGQKSSPEALRVSAERIVQYGMIEAEAIVDADYAVYDPQNANCPTQFGEGGSSARHLALVLNSREAWALSDQESSAPATMAAALHRKTGADVIVIKMGPRGALVLDGITGVVDIVSAFETDKVWKIGSGDVFAAHFGHHWMSQALAPLEAARLASKATAYYCATQGFPTPVQLAEFTPSPLVISPKFQAGAPPRIYLAGPFFTLSQIWLVEQARVALINAGLDVFSPYHDVGHGNAAAVVGQDIAGIHNSDLVFAIGDGLDAGTIYEVGYARALDKPVIVYCENESEEDRKMMEGSACVICRDFTTAVYKALWVAARM